MFFNLRPSFSNARSVWGNFAWTNFGTSTQIIGKIKKIKPPTKIETTKIINSLGVDPVKIGKDIKIMSHVKRALLGSFLQRVGKNAMSKLQTTTANEKKDISLAVISTPKRANNGINTIRPITTVGRIFISL